MSLFREELLYVHTFLGRMPLDKCTECIEIGFFGMHIWMYKMFTYFLFWLLNHLSNLHVLNLALCQRCTSVTHFNNIFQQHNYVVHISLFKKNTPQKRCTWLVTTRYRPTYNILCSKYASVIIIRSVAPIVQCTSYYQRLTFLSTT